MKKNLNHFHAWYFQIRLFSDLCQASRFFITYSPSSLKLLQNLDKQYNTNFQAKFQAHYSQGVRQYYIAFLNSDTQIFIPNFTLTAPTKIFTLDDSKLIIHPSDQACGQTMKAVDEELEPIPLFLYPKWEKKGRYVLKAIKEFLDKNNYLKGRKIFLKFYIKAHLNLFRHYCGSLRFSQDGGQ